MGSSPRPDRLLEIDGQPDVRNHTDHVGQKIGPSGVEPRHVLLTNLHPIGPASLHQRSEALKIEGPLGGDKVPQP